MKIGIMTVSRVDNNGTNLQALAMQKLFKKFCSDVQLINYKCEKLENSRKMFYPHTLKGFLSIPWKIANHYNHEKFRRKHFVYSKNVYTKNELADLDYDAIVVGSDQIWNLSITGGDLSFFLPFDCKGKKYSYAASIGKTNVEAWEKKYGLSKHLNNLECVSVRERSGVDAFKGIGVSSRFDLDPLLMLEKEEWLKYHEPTNFKKKYVFVYLADGNSDAMKFAKKYAREHNLEVVAWGNYIKPVFGVKTVKYSGIGKWLSYINNAEIVVTNSYHCLAFTILYNKNFTVFHLKDQIQSNTRLDNLINNVGLATIDDGAIYEPDWQTVESALGELRKASFEYIEKCFGE